MVDNAKLASVIVIKGILENVSPFVIGTGKGDIIDIEIIKDENGNPYIPATSFVGALRHFIKRNFNIEDFKKEDKNAWEYFWGSETNDNKGTQSHFIVSDLRLRNDENTNFIAVRDGVAIDEKKGIAKNQAKYDYEIVNKDLGFELKAEIKIREGFKDKENDILKILKTIITELEAGNVYFGAFATKGFGRFNLKDVSVLKFDFPDDGLEYLKYLKDGHLQKNNLNLGELDILPLKDNNDCNITADFSIKSSLIISSYTTDPEYPDKVHIKYNGKNVLTGTSLKGAIRSRAFRIVNTLCNDNQGKNEDLKILFGWADTENDKENKKKIKHKSRVIINESIIENDDVIEKEQTRIKIDRFTGGTILGALFQSKPLWHNNENIRLKIKIKEAQEWEIGLLLLVLKDLWNEDLPIGGEKNIGRGVLRGKKIEIEYKGETYIISRNEDDNNTDKVIVTGDKNKLEGFVEKFIRQIKYSGVLVC